MKYFWTTLGIIILLYLLDKLCLWLEHKGFLYYRKNKPKGGVMGSILLELDNIVNPSTRSVIEIKQNKDTVTRAEKQRSDTNLPKPN